jgi:hypothetical protein
MEKKYKTVNREELVYSTQITPEGEKSDGQLSCNAKPA